MRRDSPQCVGSLRDFRYPYSRAEICFKLLHSVFGRAVVIMRRAPLAEIPRHVGLNCIMATPRRSPDSLSVVLYLVCSLFVAAGLLFVWYQYRLYSGLTGHPTLLQQRSLMWQSWIMAGGLTLFATLTLSFVTEKVRRSARDVNWSIA